MKSVKSKQLFYLLPLLLLMVSKVNGQDFEVAPVKLDFNTEPGESQTKTIMVKNHSNKKSSYMVALGDFSPQDNGAKKSLAPNSTKHSCVNWLNITPSFFELSPGEQIILQVSMMAPSNDNSTAWCMLYIQPTQEQSSWNVDKNLGAGVMISGRIGIIIYQSPSSNSNYSIKVSGLKEVTETSSIKRKFNATIENLGDKITPCKIYLIAANMETAEEKRFPSIDIEAFPKMTRTVDLELPNELTTGKYSLTVIVDYGQKFALEGTNIMIDVKDQGGTLKLNNPVVKSDSI